MPFRKSCRCGAGAAQVAECKWENGQPVVVAGPFRGARNFIPLRSCAIMRHPHSLRSKATSFFLPSFLSQFAHCVRPSVRPSARSLSDTVLFLQPCTLPPPVQYKGCPTVLREVQCRSMVTVRKSVRKREIHLDWLYILCGRQVFLLVIMLQDSL